MTVMERLEAIERRLEQMVVRGTIAEVSMNPPRVRVRGGDGLLTDWLEWKPQRTGAVTVWSPPQIGEGCTVISDGDVNQGEVFLGSYHKAMPAPSENPYEVVTRYPDGTISTYNFETHTLSLVVVGGVDVKIDGSAKVQAGGNVLVDAANVRLNGGVGVVTGAHICQISGKPHSDCSSTVTAGK